MFLRFTFGGRGDKSGTRRRKPARSALRRCSRRPACRRKHLSSAAEKGRRGRGDQTLSNGGMPPKPRSNGGLPPGGMPPIIHARRHPAESPKIFGGRPPKAFGGIPPDACIYSAASRQQQIQHAMLT